MGWRNFSFNTSHSFIRIGPFSSLRAHHTCDDDNGPRSRTPRDPGHPAWGRSPLSVKTRGYAALKHRSTDAYFRGYSIGSMAFSRTYSMGSTAIIGSSLPLSGRCTKMVAASTTPIPTT